MYSSPLTSTNLVICAAYFLQITVIYRRQSLEDSGPAFINLLAYLPLDDHASDWDDLLNDQDAMDELNHLFYYFVGENYGVRSMNHWLRGNKHKSIIERYTAQDIAFTLVVYENYQPKWKEELAQQLLAEEDAEREETSAAAVEDGSDAQEPANKKRKTHDLLYTRSGGKREYLKTSWTEEGLLRYKQLCTRMSELLSNKKVWQGCIESWESYVDNKRADDDTSSCWVHTYRKIEKEGAGIDNEDEDDDVQPVTFSFSLGDDNTDSIGDDFPSLPPINLNEMREAGE